VSAGKVKRADSSGSREAGKARAKSSTAQELKQELPVARRAKPKVRPERIEDALRYLLRHFEDSTSADKDEKAAWNEQYSRFRDYAPGPMLARFEGLRDDRRWYDADRPVEPALQWVLYGKDFPRRAEWGIHPGEQEAAELAAQLDLKGAVDALCALPCFPSAHDPHIVLMWCAQALVPDLLPACCHLAFSGPPSSGKTTALKSVLAIVDGLLVSDASEAYITRIFDDGRILGFDEVDEQLWAHKDGMLESILRQATDPKAMRRICEKTDDGEIVTRELRLYRPSAFTYSSGIEGALMTRTLLVRLEPDADSARIIRNLYSEKDLAALRIWLRDRADEVRQSWTTEKVEELMRSESFCRRLDKLQEGLPRDKQLAAILLATAEMFGWTAEVEEAILSRLRAATEDRISDTEVLVLGALAEAPWQPPLAPGEHKLVWQEDLLTLINERHKAQGLKSMSPERLGRILTRLGLRDGVDRIKVRRERGKRCILRTENVEKLLSGSSPFLPFTGPTGATGASWQASLDEAAAPVAPVAPVGESIEEGEAAAIDRELYDSARRRIFERPGETEDWYVQDLMLAHQILEKDRLAVKEIVHRAYLVSLRERTPGPAASSEEISADQAEGPAGKEEQLKRDIRSLAVLEHLRSPEEPPEEIAPRIADNLRKRGHVVDLEQVKVEAKDVIELALRHASREGGRSLPSRSVNSDKSHEDAKGEGGPPP
jgi:hypothetical protein